MMESRSTHRDPNQWRPPCRCTFTVTMTDIASYRSMVQVPHYQRVSTSGDDCTGVPIEDLKSAAEMLVQVDITLLSRCVDI